jgi:hypothetical protein
MKLSITLRYCALAALAITLLMFGTPAKADLVLNGNFTSTTLSSPGGYVCNTVGPTCTSSVTDWSATCASTGVCGNGGTPLSLLFAGTGGVAFNGFNGLNTPASDPPGGGNYIGDDGDPFYRAPLFQTITGLTPGGQYLLTFYQASDQQGGFSSPTTDYWQVSLGSSTLNSAAIVQSGGTFSGWIPQSLTFTATSSSELLNFLSIGPGGVPPVVLLANVSLSQVPEPSVLIPLAGLVGLLAYRLRRMRRA